MIDRMVRFLAACCLAAAAIAWPATADAQMLQNCKKAFGLNALHNSQTPPTEAGVTRTVYSDSVELTCDDMHFYADVIEDQSDDDFIHARGNVLLTEPGLRIFATRADFNRKTHLGTFYDAAGSWQLTERRAERSLFGSLEPDVFFWGERIDKTGPRSYRLSSGGFTTCVQPTPRWEMASSGASLTLEAHAVLRNVVLKVKGVPLLYLPIIYYPMSRQGRSTGILMPTYGSSAIRGFTLSNAFFWAINRSQDATFYHDWFSKTGQGFGGEYRYISSPASSGNMRLYVIDERATLNADGTEARPAHRSYDVRGQLNQGLPHGFRLFAQSNYFTDASTQQLYQQSVYDFSQRNRNLGATLSGGFGRLRLRAAADRNDVYYGTNSAQRVEHLPVVNLDFGDKPIGHSHVYFGARGETGHFSRLDDIANPDTARRLWRVDLAPTIRMPVSTLPYLSLTTSASWRYTYWSDSRDPVSGKQVTTPLTRQLLDLQAQFVGPRFSRIFQTPGSGYAERFKHLLEPAVTVHWFSPFSAFDRVSQAASDGTDTVVGGMTQVDYSVTQRLLAKRRTPGSQTSTAREILSAEIGQTYYTNARAAAYDQQYQSSFATGTTAFVQSPFSPVRLSFSARPFDSVGGQFRMEYDARFHAVRTLAATGNVNRPDVQVSAGWSKRQFIKGLPGFDNPDFADQSLTSSTTVQDREKRVGATFSFNYDLHHRAFQQTRVVAFYNSQCCGISFDYQTVTFPVGGSIYKGDRRWGVSFTLAGLGSFSNPMGAFGNNSGSR